MPTIVETLTIEEKEIFIFKQKPLIVRDFCAVCRIEVSMITPAHAALLTARNIEKIYSSMEKGLVHFSLRKNGKPLVCLNSVCLI